MNYFLLEPSVDGGWGPETVSQHRENGTIRCVDYLHFEFAQWLGDDLITTHPCFLVSLPLAEAILRSPLRGYAIEDVLISISDEYEELWSPAERSGLPVFKRFRPLLSVASVGEAEQHGMDTYIYGKYGDLLVSDRLLDLLRRFQLKYCEISKLDE